jgi:hypothetical protein
MIKFFPFLLMFISIAHGNECVEDAQIRESISPCQMSYSKFAPECTVGDSTCLSLVLHGLVNKDVFHYNADLGKLYNTPLKRKHFRQTEEYKNRYRALLKDLEEANGVTFCAEMNTYWLYDLKNQGFLFHTQSLIPSKLFRYSNIEKVLDYNLIKVNERDAVDIESWENLAGTKYVFFTFRGSDQGYVRVEVSHFIWFVPSILFDSKRGVLLNYEEGCPNDTYFKFEVK